MKYLFRALASLFVIIVVFASSVNALGLPIKSVLLSTGEGFEKYQTTAITVGDFLAEKDIEITTLDSVSVPLDTIITENFMIKVNKAFSVTLVIDGSTVSAMTNSITVKEFVQSYSQETGFGYFYDKSIANDVLYDDSVLSLTTCYTDIITTVEDVPYETVYIENCDITEEQVFCEGEFGERVIKTEITYIGGNPADSEVIYDNIDTEPVKRIVYVPFDKAVSASEQESVEYSAHYTMKATAYTLDPVCVGDNYYSNYGVTASGMKARVGVVAVDPKVIPLGTELYISGYGYAIAGDTGGAIKGNKIDLFFDTLDECYRYGVRDVEVYVVSK